MSDKKINVTSEIENENNKPSLNTSDDEVFVNLSLANTQNKVVQNVEKKLDIKENVEEKKEEIHKEIGELKAEAVHKIEEVQKEVNEKKNDTIDKASEVKDNIKENVTENIQEKKNEITAEANKVTAEANKIKEEFKENKNEIGAKVEGVAGTASLLKENAATTAEQVIGGSSKPISGDQKDLSLYAHNYIRKLHGVSPMKWDDKLAEQSKKWAMHLAETDAGLQHSDPLDGFGENLYISKGSSAATGPHQAVLQWYKTVIHYNFDNPRFNLSSGTFTQLVWDDSLKFGVGIAYREDTRNTYIVAQYSPPGNGRFSESFKHHVKKPLAGLPARIPKLEELLPANNENNDNKEKPSNMKSIFDVLCKWCASKEDKPVESWSGVQSTEDVKVSDKAKKTSDKAAKPSDKTPIENNNEKNNNKNADKDKKDTKGYSGMADI